LQEVRGFCRRHVHAVCALRSARRRLGECRWRQISRRPVPVRNSPPGSRNLREFEIAPEQHTTMPDGYP
jgi:hypothetical protein